MSNVNTVVISGNLTRDPELKWLSDEGDRGILGLGVAVNRSVKDENAEGGYREEASFFDVTVYGKYSLLVSRKARKADHVTVSGRLEQETWEKDGEKKSKVTIVANTIDGDCFFRPKDEDVQRSVGGNESTSGQQTMDTTSSGVTQSPPPAPPASDDDIPF